MATWGFITKGFSQVHPCFPRESYPSEERQARQPTRPFFGPMTTPMGFVHLGSVAFLWEELDDPGINSGL